MIRKTEMVLMLNENIESSNRILPRKDRGITAPDGSIGWMMELMENQLDGMIMMILVEEMLSNCFKKI